ncbi:AAA family ATPase [Bradymonadaceae bacterium TMQ3]|nr:AAA family ATPase [Bradymonadaceae bacterium TMQ3]TXC67677.1 AAA family ATPase [Bradymonadales bacterium TMQ1]
MNQEELDTLREGWDFEAKLAAGRDGKGAIPDSMWETYSAMANTSGGVILLGARELKDGSLEFRGLGDITRVETDLWNQLQNPEKVSANILTRESVEQVEVNGVDILLIHVPKASRADRPVFIKGSWETGTYVRVHEGDRRLSMDVARRMVADAINDRDASVLEDFTLDDLHAGTIRRYREFFAARRPEHPYLEKDDEDFLIAIGAAKRRRGGDGVIRPTLAGLWMLGDEIAIRDLLPHWHLSYKELPEDPNDSRRWLDRVHPDGTWNANIFAFYLRVIHKLHSDLKIPFEIEQGQFRKDETPVHVAIREALVNTLVHADYRGTTGVRIIKKRSGFEFINPGLLLISTQQVWEGGVSEPRNPMLHRLFGLPQLGEREGSGGPTMRKVWREQHWRAPQITQDVEHNETHLELRQESLFPDAIVNELVERWGARFTEQDELGRTILVMAEVEESINHGTVAALSDAHPRDITLKLQELVRQGLLDSHGARRGMTYTPGVQPNLSLFEEAERSSQSSLEDGASLIQRIAGSSWAAQKDVRRAIFLLCADEYRTVSEIAAALNRKPITVQQNYVSKMVADGELQTKFSDSTHPKQAYRTTQHGKPA